MSFFSAVKLRNAIESFINPATEEKQDTIITYVDGIESALSTMNANDFSTEAKQDTIIANQTNGTQSAVIVDGSNEEVIQQKTAFGEDVVAELHPVSQQSFEFTVDNTKLCTHYVQGSGGVTQANAMAVVGTGTTTGSKARLESHAHLKYRAGLGGLLRFTALFTAPVAGTEQFFGILDEKGSSAEFKNGYAIGYEGTSLRIERYHGDSVTSVLRVDWEDPLDGTGTSGINIDFTKLNVFQIQYQYLGAGQINFFVEHPDTGKFYRFHRIKYSNRFTTPSTENPNYHFQAYVDNGATTSDMVIKTSSYGFFVEGKTQYVEIQQPQATSGTRSKTTVTAEVAIFTIRNRSTYASKTNYIDILMERFGTSIEASSANNLGTIRLVKNATLGGSPSYSDISTTDSVVEIDTAGTTVTGGTELVSVELAGKNDKVNENVLPYTFFIHPGDSVTVAGLSTNSATIKASILWKELF